MYVFVFMVASFHLDDEKMRKTNFKSILNPLNLFLDTDCYDFV